MKKQITLEMGDHELALPVNGWIARYVDSFPPSVQLIASIQAPPRQMTGQSREEKATTLAIPMDARVALDLYRRIGLVAEQMGWTLPK